jgi:gamma-glutamylcysteine synthetase
MTKINLLPILDWQKQELLDMFKQYPEQVEQVEQIITKINNGEEYETAMAAVSEQLPNYNNPPSENAPCKGLNEKDNNFCSQINDKESCSNAQQQVYRDRVLYAGTKQRCKWTPA